MVALLTFGTVLWLLLLLLFLSGEAASAFHPLSYYLLFHGLVFVARPWLNWWYGYRFVYQAFQFTPTAAERITALLVADVGLVAFALPLLWIGNAPLRLKPAPERRTMLHRRYRGSLWAAALLCAPVGLLSLAHGLRVRLEDSGGMAMDPTNGVFTNTGGNGYLTDAHGMLVPLVVAIAWMHRFRPVSLLPFLAYAAVRGVTGTARWSFLMAAASLALLFLYEHRARWMRAELLAPAVAVLALFTLLGGDRAGVEAWLHRPKVEVAAAPPPALHPLEDENYANQEFLEYLVRAVPARTGRYGWFLDNIQLFTEPVPRALWPGKPAGPPIQRFHLFDYGRPIGMTLSLPGEGWIQAGWAGVVVWCGLAGVAFGLAYRWFAGTVQTEFQVAAYLLLLPLSVQFFRDGTLVTAARFPLFYLPPLGLWWAFARWNGRRVVERRTLRPRAGPA
jgi:hypothetical protein